MKDLKHVIRTVKSSSPILYTIVLIHLVVAVACIIGLVVDDRTLLGVNVWIKPLKFMISGAVYLFTAGFLITLYPFSKRKKNIINNINSFCLLIEGSIIVAQASRGIQSHYNTSTPLDAILFAMMGLLIGINVIIMVWFLIETVRLKMNTSKPVQFGIFLGWIIIIVGSWVGGQMIGQLSHNVGVADGGAGLPLLNWSTIAGDLRVAHFFGLHGIQVIPLVGFFLSQKWNTSTRNQIIATGVFGMFYASFVAWTYYQASSGLALLEL